MRKISIVVIAMFLLGSCAETAPKKLLTLTKVFSSYIRGDVVGKIEVGDIFDSIFYTLPVLLDNSKIVVTKDAKRQEVAASFDLGEKIVDTYFNSSINDSNSDGTYRDDYKYGMICLTENQNFSYIEILLVKKPFSVEIKRLFKIKVICDKIIGHLENREDVRVYWENEKLKKPNFPDYMQSVFILQTKDKKALYGYYLNGEMAFELNFEKPTNCGTSGSSIGLLQEYEFTLLKYIDGKLFKEYFHFLYNTPEDASNCFGSNATIINPTIVPKCEFNYPNQFYIYYLNYLAVFSADDANLLALLQTDELDYVMNGYFFISNDGFVKIKSQDDDKNNPLNLQYLQLITERLKFLGCLWFPEDEHKFFFSRYDAGKSHFKIISSVRIDPDYKFWQTDFEGIADVIVSAIYNRNSKNSKIYIFCESGNVYQASMNELNDANSITIEPKEINLKADNLTEEERARFFGNK